jgi:hypothetical protein
LSSPPPEPARRTRRATIVAALALAAFIGIARAADTPSPPAPASPTSPAPAAAQVAAATAWSASEVASAAQAVAADPALGGEHKVRTWRFKRGDDDKAVRREAPAPWLLELRRWLAEGGRALVWLLALAALATVIVASRRWWAVHGQALAAGSARLPSHVRDLDIRPESLPAEIGAAVRAAWLAGEHRVALSLLYRGALSRLAHGLGVPIEDSSTEGDCIRLAEATLGDERSAFAARLIGAWQLAVYGKRRLPTPLVLALCDEFDRLLPAAAKAAR